MVWQAHRAEGLGCRVSVSGSKLRVLSTVTGFRVPRVPNIPKP